MIEKENKHLSYFDKNYKNFLIRYFLDINTFDMHIHDKHTKALVTSLSESTAGSRLGEETTSCSSAMIKSSAVIPNSTALE